MLHATDPAARGEETVETNGRYCGVCRARGDHIRRTPEDLRHLHELPEGAAFRFAYSGRASRVLSKGGGRVEVSEPGPGERVRFETHEGREVDFRRNGDDGRLCSPTAIVEPLGRWAG